MLSTNGRMMTLIAELQKTRRLNNETGPRRVTGRATWGKRA